MKFSNWFRCNECGGLFGTHDELEHIYKAQVDLYIKLMKRKLAQVQADENMKKYTDIKDKPPTPMTQEIDELLEHLKTQDAVSKELQTKIESLISKSKENHL